MEIKPVRFHSSKCAFEVLVPEKQGAALAVGGEFECAGEILGFTAQHTHPCVLSRFSHGAGQVAGEKEGDGFALFPAPEKAFFGAGWEMDFGGSDHVPVHRMFQRDVFQGAGVNVERG